VTPNDVVDAPCPTTKSMDSIGDDNYLGLRERVFEG
jgi:hypothetical protein